MYTTAAIGTASAFLIVTEVLILGGNTLVILAVYRNPPMQTVMNILIVNLAVCDLLVGVFNCPFMLTALLAGDWLAGPVMCKVSGFCNVLFCCASILTLTTISIDRYFCITRPTKVVFTKPKVVYAIILIWIYVTFLAAMPLVGWNQYVYVDDRKHCMIFWQMGGVHSAYGVFLSGSTFLVPTWIMVFCYYKIFRTSSQQAKKFRKRVMPTFESTNDNTNSSNVRGHHRSGIPNRDCLFTEEDLKMTCNDTQCKAVSTKNVIDLKPQIAKNGIKSNPVKVLSDGVEAKCDSHSYPMGNTVTVGIQDVGTSSSESSGSASLKHVDHGKITHAAPSQTSGESNTVRKQARERRTAQVILVVIAVFQICWMPYATLNQWSAFSGETPQGTADLATSLLGYFNSACNAFIYTAFNTRFRLAFKQIIWRKNSRTFSQR